MFERKCPKCGRVIKYSSKKCLDRSIKKKRLCSICAGKARYVDGKHPYNYKGEKPPFERSCPKCGKIRVCTSTVTFKCFYCNATTTMKKKKEFGLAVKVLKTFDNPQEASNYCRVAKDVHENKGELVKSGFYGGEQK